MMNRNLITAWVKVNERVNRGQVYYTVNAAEECVVNNAANGTDMTDEDWKYLNDKYMENVEMFQANECRLTYQILRSIRGACMLRDMSPIKSDAVHGGIAIDIKGYGTAIFNYDEIHLHGMSDIYSFLEYACSIWCGPGRTDTLFGDEVFDDMREFLDKNGGRFTINEPVLNKETIYVGSKSKPAIVCYAGDTSYSWFENAGIFDEKSLICYSLLMVAADNSLKKDKENNDFAEAENADKVNAGAAGQNVEDSEYNRLAGMLRAYLKDFQPEDTESITIDEMTRLLRISHADITPLLSTLETLRKDA